MFQESCRFRDNALQVINSLGKCIAGFTDAEQFAQAWEQLVANHCPYIRNKLISNQKHFQVRCIVLCLPLSVHPQQAHLQTETLSGTLHWVFISLEVQCYAIIIACVANSEAVMPPQ